MKSSTTAASRTGAARHCARRERRAGISAPAVAWLALGLSLVAAPPSDADPDPDVLGDAAALSAASLDPGLAELEEAGTSLGIFGQSVFNDLTVDNDVIFEFQDAVTIGSAIGDDVAAALDFVSKLIP